MNSASLSRTKAAVAVFVLSLGIHTGLHAQQAEQVEAVLQRVPSAPPGIPAEPLPTQPWTYPTCEGFNIQAAQCTILHPFRGDGR